MFVFLFNLFAPHPLPILGTESGAVSLILSDWEF